MKFKDISITLLFMIYCSAYCTTAISETIKSEIELIDAIEEKLSFPYKRNEEPEYRESVPKSRGGITAIANVCINEKIYSVIGVPTTEYFFNNKYITKFYLINMGTEQVSLENQHAEIWAKNSFLSHVEYDISQGEMLYVYFRSDKTVRESLNGNSMFNPANCTLEQKENTYGLSTLRHN